MPVAVTQNRICGLAYSVGCVTQQEVACRAVNKIDVNDSVHDRYSKPAISSLLKAAPVILKLAVILTAPTIAQA